MSGSVKELLNNFSTSKTVSYVNRDGKITSVVLETPLIAVAEAFCEKNKLSKNEFLRVMAALAPDKMSVTKTMRIILSKMYFTGDLDIND